MFQEFEQKLMATFERVCQEVGERVAKSYENPKSRYIRQRELMDEMGILYVDIRKLEAHGLKRIKFEENARVIFYDRKNLDEVLERLAI